MNEWIVEVGIDYNYAFVFQELKAKGESIQR
jgi:hypothetical protein